MPAKRSQKAAEASFRDAYFLIKNKKAFSDGEVLKGAMKIIANTMFKNEKYGPDVISTLHSNTSQLMVFIRMVFDDFSTKEELLTLLPLKTTTQGIDNDAVKRFSVEKRIPLVKLVSLITEGAPAMTS